MATTSKPFRALNGITGVGDIEATGVLKSTQSQTNEGGEIQLSLPSSGSTLSSNVIIDVYQNKLRFFDSGGTNKGAYIDLSAATGGVGSDLLAGGGGGGATTLDGLTDVAITSPATGSILRYSGTEWVNSTLTLPNTTTANQILYSSATNTVGQITTANDSVLITNGSGVPSFSTSLPSSLTITTPALTLSTTTSTTDGRLYWDTTYHHAVIGDGSNGRIVSTLPNAVTSERNNTTNPTPYTLVAGDANLPIRINHSSAYTVNIPTNTTAFPIGTQIHIIQRGAGQVTIQALTGGTTTVLSTGGTTTAPKLRTTNSMATLIKLDTEIWMVTGDVV